MRIAAFVVVLAIHALLFFLFAALRGPSRQLSEPEVPTTLVFMSESEMNQPGEAVPKPPVVALAPPVAAHTAQVTARAARPAAPRAPAAVSPAPKPESEPPPESEPESESGPVPWSITPTPAPDWRAEAQIVANDEIEAEARNRERPSPLAPHDFSGVAPGSTDTSKPKFGWYGASIHRVEGTPGMGVTIHINDRCAVAIVFIFPFPMCKIGKMAARGDLLDHMTDVPAAGDSKLP